MQSDTSVEDAVMIMCWSLKGGSGTSVATVALALASQKIHGIERTLLVDLDGDLPAILGAAEPVVGISEWIAQPTAFDLNELIVGIESGLCLLPRGNGPLPEDESGSWLRLARELEAKSALGTSIIVDCGKRRVPTEFSAVVSRHFLVVRPCYLALRRARLVESPIDGVILVAEPNRVLTASDVASVLGVSVSARLPLTADIARRVDAGVIASRPPRALIDSVAGLIDVQECS